MLPTEWRVSGVDTDAVSVEPPIFVQACGRRFVVATLVFMAAWLAAALWVASVLPLAGPLQLWCGVGVLILAGRLEDDIVKGLWALKERGLKRRAALMGYALCCQCGYSLRGLDEQRQCPECGWHFHSLEEVQAAWRDWEPKRPPWLFRAVAALVRRFRRRS